MPMRIARFSDLHFSTSGEKTSLQDENRQGWGVGVEECFLQGGRLAAGAGGTNRKRHGNAERSAGWPGATNPGFSTARSLLRPGAAGGGGAERPVWGVPARKPDKYGSPRVTTLCDASTCRPHP